MKLADLASYFSGKHFVPIDKGGFEENQIIPAADETTIKGAVARAVKDGLIWLVNGTISILGDEAPAGFLNDSATLYPPPPRIEAADLLPAQLADAWDGEETDAHLIHGALSVKAGKPLPWLPVRQALEDAFRLGVFERTVDSGPWPCDLGGAPTIKLRVADSQILDSQGESYGGKQATAELETHEIQDLAEGIDELRQVTAGHTLRIKVKVAFGEAGNVDQEMTDRVNALLEKIKPGWRVE